MPSSWSFIQWYYAWNSREPSARARAERRLEVEIQAAYRHTRETYSPERLQHDLAEHGAAIGLHRIKRIRRKLGLRYTEMPV